MQFHFLGWAHTRGDGFAWLPKEKVLCTGDAATNGPYNYTADGNVGNWPKVMAAAEKFQPRYVLPGHGPAGGPEVLTGEANFMTELHKAVEQAAAQGKKLDSIVTMKDGKPSATNIKLSAGVQNWVGDSLPGQVADAYNEVTQKKPAGDLAHQ